MKTKNNKNLSRIYISAAESIFNKETELSCIAVCKGDGIMYKNVKQRKNRVLARKLYSDIFDCELKVFGAKYYHLTGTPCQDYRELIEIRVLALCLMAQICKSF